jgi:predicted RNase H-like nuclease (RuvC/YqgF family)
MSLAAQIEELEEELEHYQSENTKLNDALSDADDRIEDLEHDCEAMDKFIEFVDKTNPELRVAYDAAKALEGKKT